METLKASPFELAVGSLIGAYRIEALAGRGGMGVVYRATQLGLGRTVALKLIAPQVAHDELFRERFKRESRLAASLDHPNVIPVYEAGEANGSLFLAMRWIEGSDLLTMIKRGGGLEPDQAARITSQVAGALESAHQHGLIHRDVKPANILVAPAQEDHVYLTDFGLVKLMRAATQVTQSGEFVGSLDYIAPEQIEGRPSSCSDVYSLGCVLFHALTGRVPFDRDSEIAKIAAHLHESPPRPTQVRPDVPPPFDEVVAQAMAKDPKQRYPTAAEVGRAALAAANGSVKRARKGTRGAATALLPTARRSPWRRRGLWGIAGLLALGAVAAAVLAAGGFSGGGANASGRKGGHTAATRKEGLVKARGEPGIYMVTAGARFLISARDRARFFADEREPLRLISSAALHRLPVVPPDGTVVKPYGTTLAWVIRHGYRYPIRRPAGFTVIPPDGLGRIPLPPGGHPTRVTVATPGLVYSARDFRLTARVSSAAGVPRGTCLFFRLQGGDLLERANVEARNGQCTAMVHVVNMRQARYSVHFFGDSGWQGSATATRWIDVQRP